MIAAVVCTGTDWRIAALGFGLMILSSGAIVWAGTVAALRRARELAREERDR